VTEATPDPEGTNMLFYWAGSNIFFIDQKLKTKLNELSKNVLVVSWELYQTAWERDSSVILFFYYSVQSIFNWLQS
jgi:hypothetical protein